MSTPDQASLGSLLTDALTGLVDERPVSRSLVEAVARVLRASADPLQAAFLARSLNALARVTPQLDAQRLGDATGEPSDYAVLVHALEQPEVLAILQGEDPLAEARLRDLGVREETLRAEGGTLTAEEVGRRLGITRQAVDKRRQAGRLLALPIGQHRYAYPEWQFGPSGLLPGFSEVTAELSTRDPWTQALFFLQGNTVLEGRRPLDELRGGHVEAVRRAAWALGEHGAA